MQSSSLLRQDEIWGNKYSGFIWRLSRVTNDLQQPRVCLTWEGRSDSEKPSTEQQSCHRLQVLFPSVTVHAWQTQLDMSEGKFAVNARWDSEWHRMKLPRSSGEEVWRFGAGTTQRPQIFLNFPSHSTKYFTVWTHTLNPFMFYRGSVASDHRVQLQVGVGNSLLIRQ